ncbi:MAG: hypothetical protein Kow0077_09810 [Anaerolineae bacterium]
MRRFIDWLGRERALALFMLVAITGTASLMLQAVGDEADWVIPVQNILVLVAIGGGVVIPLTRLDPIDRRPLVVAVAPLIVGIGLGLFLPQAMFWFVGAGVGWLVLSLLILRRNVRREYQQAIRHLRKGEYDQAIQIINQLVKAEPEDTRHYRFRADLFRLKGKPQQAIRDYERIVRLEPESSVGYNGLAEIYLQLGDHAQAWEYAFEAYKRDPQQWALAYNLGMVADRLGRWEDVLAYLQEALDARPPDSRHRLLIHLWRARAAMRSGQPDLAEEAVSAMKREKAGLKEWETIFASEMSAALRNILAEDLALAHQLYEGAAVSILAGGEDTTPVNEGEA